METALHTNTTTEETTNQLFPVFIKLNHLQILLVGGGKIALEKLHALLSNFAGAAITIVATNVSDEIKELVEKKDNISIVEKDYEHTDLEGKDLVFVATGNIALAEVIFNDTRSRNLLINVADTPLYCDFYLGSIVKKGQLKIAISTNGKSPTIAKRLKEVLQKAIPDNLNDSINHLHLIRNRLNGDFEKKVKKLNKLTHVLVNEKQNIAENNIKKAVVISLAAFALMLFGHFFFSYIISFNAIKDALASLYHSIDSKFPVMFIAGFVAQLVDGALGMGYGVASTTILLSAGVAPATISGSIHTAEMFASAASGYSHYKFGNVNKKLFKALVIPGIIGAIAGAVLLWLLDESYGSWVRPALAVYTMFLGLKIIWNVYKNENKKKKFKNYKLLAGTGGFFDSFGGGGWGPIVTTTLITKGRTPRFVIGSVSATEFFVTFASALTFFILLGVTHWQTILGLIAGGLIAAPIAAKLAGKLPRRTAMLLLGALVIFWSLRILVKLL